MGREGFTPGVIPGYGLSLTLADLYLPGMDDARMMLKLPPSHFKGLYLPGMNDMLKIGDSRVLQEFVEKYTRFVEAATF